MKIITTAFLLFLSISCYSQTDTSVYKLEAKWGIAIECVIDTIKGTIYYHSRTDNNYGNAWDVGYWVGKCSPHGIIGEQIFIPGEIKITEQSKERWEKKWTTHERVITNGAFYDSQWKRIPSKDVYGLLVPNVGGTAQAPKAF